ncbi:hypothetical protein [Fructobacillus tropaeoli]|uniref:hypothetical protein n=1 Tax=Fructobacillus tropaeoli TaxID=709323 RepID=UPI002D8DC8B1|nr:unnamed protein product [Fructobacillus tropaeoli]
MDENILNIVCSLCIVVAFTFGIVAWVTDDDYRKVIALLLALVGLVGLFAMPVLDKWEQYQDSEHQSKIQHLQSEVPKDVSLQKLDSQLNQRDIDLDDADSVSYDNGVLKIFFSEWHLFTGHELTTWFVKLHDNSIDSTSRSHS